MPARIDEDEPIIIAQDRSIAVLIPVVQAAEQVVLEHEWLTIGVPIEVVVDADTIVCRVGHDDLLGWMKASTHSGDLCRYLTASGEGKVKCRARPEYRR